jgi:hypothetical protein
MLKTPTTKPFIFLYILFLLIIVYGLHCSMLNGTESLSSLSSAHFFSRKCRRTLEYILRREGPIGPQDTEKKALASSAHPFAKCAVPTLLPLPKYI